MILVQLPQDDGHIRIGHKLVYIVRTVKDRIYEIALSLLPFQYIVERIGETQGILGCTVVKRNIITTSVQLMVSLLALTVGIEPVIPRNKVFVILERSGRILQPFQSLRPKLTLQELSFGLLVPGIVAVILYGIFCGIGFYFINDTLFLCKSAPCLFVFLGFRILGISIAVSENILFPSLLFGRIIGIVIIGSIIFRIIPKGGFILVLVIDYVIGIIRFIFIFVIGIFFVKTVIFISFGIVVRRRNLPSKIFFKFSLIFRKNSSAKHPVFLLLVRE